MSDTAASVQRSVKIGRLQIEEHLLLRLLTWAILLALATAVVLLRLDRLDELPPGLMRDEEVNGRTALRVLQGKHAIFFPDVGHGRNASIIYAPALSTLLFGRSLFAMHLPTALGSAGMVFAVFWMGRLLFGGDEEGGQATPWRGLLIGGVAAGVMAVSISQTVMGRTAYNDVTFMALLLTLFLGLLWRGWKERRWLWVVLAGVCAGLASYTNYPARLVPILFLVYALGFLFPLRAGAWERVRAEIPWAAAFLGPAALVAAPQLIYFALYPEHFFLRSNHLWFFAAESSQGNPLQILLINIWENVSILGWGGDLDWRNNYVDRPMLNPWEALFFWLGVGIALWRWRQRHAYRYLLIWMGVMLLPAVLSREYFIANMRRMMGAIPAIYLLLGVGVWEVFRFLKERYFGKHAVRAGIVAGSVVGVAVLTQGINTHRTYFSEWAVAPQVRALYHATMTEMMKAQEAQISMPGVVYLFPEIIGNHGFEYLHDKPPVHFLRAAEPDLPQTVESLLARHDELSTVKVMEWGHFPDGEKELCEAVAPEFGCYRLFPAWWQEEPHRFIYLLSKYGRYQGSEEYAGHRLHSFTDISLLESWRFYDELEPQTVQYDGGIALQGLALGQGAKQMSTQQTLELGRERPMWMALQWQIAPDLDTDYAISLRLHNAAGERAFQEDLVLWNAGHRPTSGWPAHEPVDALNLIRLPADLPAGEYELRIVVYDAETLVPTVVVGLWEPEVTLGRVRLAEVQ